MRSEKQRQWCHREVVKDKCLCCCKAPAASWLKAAVRSGDVCRLGSLGLGLLLACCSASSTPFHMQEVKGSQDSTRRIIRES